MMPPQVSLAAPAQRIVLLKGPGPSFPSFRLAMDNRYSEIQNNMRRLQTLVETYAVDWGGHYPVQLSVMQKHAQFHAYWIDLTNHLTGKKGIGGAMMDYSHYAKTASRRSFAGMVLYQGSQTSYKIYGCDQQGNLIGFTLEPIKSSKPNPVQTKKPVQSPKLPLTIQLTVLPSEDKLEWRNGKVYYYSTRFEDRYVFDANEFKQHIRQTNPKAIFVIYCTLLAQQANTYTAQVHKIETIGGQRPASPQPLHSSPPHVQDPKRSALKANMHSLQVIVEKYAANHSGYYPTLASVLQTEAQTRLYWIALSNPYSGRKNFGGALMDYSLYAKTSSRRSFAGMVLYQGSQTSYKIYGCDQQGNLLKSGNPRGDDFVLSPS